MTGSGQTCPLPVTIVHDNDGRRSSLTLGSSPGVATGYQYDSDSRPTQLSYSAGGNSLGQINYTYDNDSRVTSETGSLASLNLPASVSNNAYYNTNQIQKWNGATPTATPDPANNLMADPTTHATFSWDSRNQLSGITGGPAVSFTGAYDSVMRRYDQATAYGGTTTYLHDNKHVAQSDSSSGVNNYLTMPGTGEVLAFTTAGNTYVPLHDRLGSTIGLVNSSNSLQTQYTPTIRSAT
jgi:hypothetical protein